MVLAAVYCGVLALAGGFESVFADGNIALPWLWFLFCIILLISAAVIVLFPLRASLPGTGRILYGVTLINDGFEYYPDWCGMMLREFDESIKTNLEHDYGLAKSIARHPRDQWSILIAQSLETDSIDRDNA